MVAVVLGANQFVRKKAGNSSGVSGSGFNQHEIRFRD
jgi:hypothetical protein